MSKRNAYETWIASLDAEQRNFVQTIMAHVMVMLDDRFNSLAGDVQRLERRHIARGQRIDELQLRLDQYEDRQWSMAKEAIEQFAATQLPTEQRDALVATLYRLAADVEALKAKQGGDAESAT